jgi:hypothetical protein|tara:strand:+ start:1228 stop:1533 length:306 start_codon:yes stop_codon:yes gene_type:complete
MMLYLLILVCVSIGALAIAWHDASPQYPWPRSSAGECLLSLGGALGAGLLLVGALALRWWTDPALYTLAAGGTFAVPATLYWLALQGFSRFHRHQVMMCRP